MSVFLIFFSVLLLVVQSEPSWILPTSCSLTGGCFGAYGAALNSSSFQIVLDTTPRQLWDGVGCCVHRFIRDHIFVMGGGGGGGGPNYLLQLFGQGGAFFQYGFYGAAAYCLGTASECPPQQNSTALNGTAFMKFKARSSDTLLAWKFADFGQYSMQVFLKEIRISPNGTTFLSLNQTFFPDYPCSCPDNDCCANYITPFIDSLGLVGLIVSRQTYNFGVSWTTLLLDPKTDTYVVGPSWPPGDGYPINMPSLTDAIPVDFFGVGRKQDVVFADSQQFSLILSNSSERGAFHAAVHASNDAVGGQFLSEGDLNGDGRSDLVFLNSGELQVNSPDSKSTSYILAWNSTGFRLFCADSCDLVDVNSDSRADLVCFCNFDDAHDPPQFYVFINAGDFAFKPPIVTTFNPWPGKFAPYGALLL